MGEARAAAADWVRRHARDEPGYRGAYFAGSTVGLPDDAELSPVSDVDVMVISAAEDPGQKPGKFRHRGVLIEASYVAWDEVADAEAVLASYHVAGGFRTDTIIDDPTGHLRALTARVSRDFADPVWVHRRCDDALGKIERRLRAIDPSAPFHQQVLAWLFPTGVTTHVLLVAGLRNPTVRLRYLAARDVLTDYGRAAFYPDLLELLGCVQLSPARVQHHLDALGHTFDATDAVARTPFFFSSDITAEARPIAIDGSQRLIDRGLHREAVFWIIATFARCHTILAADAPERHRALYPAFVSAVDDLGIHGAADIARRADDVIQFLPRLREVATAIISVNPAVANQKS